MTRSNDAPPPELLRVFVGQIIRVPLVENTIGERTTGADGEEVAFEPLAV